MGIARCIGLAVCNQWTGSLDWTTGLAQFCILMFPHCKLQHQLCTIWVDFQLQYQKTASVAICSICSIITVFHVVKDSV